MNSIFGKFTSHSKNALKNAFGFALKSGHRNVTPGHILHSLSREKGSIASQILSKAKINEEAIKKIIISNTATRGSITQIGLSNDTKKLLERAFLIANQNNHKYIGTEHLLASILSVPDEFTKNLMASSRINPHEIKRQINTIFNSTSRFPEITGSLDDIHDREDGMMESFDGAPMTRSTKPQPTALELFATNLTDKHFQQKVDPVIGRQEEIDRVIQILSRRNKNNPLLLGDPGVGKTAIVEGLAKKIVTGEVPEVLIDKKIFSLDLSLVVAGTSFRGEFENRLKQIINEVKKDPEIILFIDEIHNIIGVGSASGSMDAANILKPALARGEIRCIGATTTEEFKKYIESDPALERRFQPILVDEASIEKTIDILQGVKDNYEVYHQVKIEPSAITSAAKLSHRYITDRFLPDKAIDLIDEAASAVKVKYLSTPKMKELKQLERELYSATQKKQQAVEQEKYNQALKYKEQADQLSSELFALKEKSKSLEQQYLASINDKDIAKIVSKMTGVPLDDLINKEKYQLLNLEKTLAKKIIDQDQAISSISQFIKRSRTGISDANRPIGSFMFMGPSGVGKTQLAKTLAQTVFRDPKALIKIDMSEFAESFNISKLIGAPAGYVGYKEGAKLTDAIKQKPYSVILFDEIEKAHRQIFNLLLQVLDEGYLTDGAGKKINFKNSIIIMTSNIGSEHFNQQAAIGFDAQTDDKIQLATRLFEETEKEVIKKLKDDMPPEFLSRIDQTIVFKPLSKNTLIKIAKLQLKELKNRLEKQGIKIEIASTVARLVAEQSYAPNIGARSVRKTIQENIENQIANKILKSKSRPQKISIKVKNGKIII